LAEVPVAAVVGQTVVTGQVDRLLLLPDRIVVVDFKTGRFVPDTIDQVRVGYIRQMAYYAAALARIYPGRRVEAALLYTNGPRMVTVPDAMLADYAPG
jgi:ATP-dependent helicase/nuclease subunit A